MGPVGIHIWRMWYNPRHTTSLDIDNELQFMKTNEHKFVIILYFHKNNDYIFLSNHSFLKDTQSLYINLNPFSGDLSKLLGNKHESAVDKNNGAEDCCLDVEI